MAFLEVEIPPHRRTLPRNIPSPYPLMVAIVWLLLGVAVADAVAPPRPPGDPDRFILLGDQLIWCEGDYGPSGFVAPVEGVGSPIHAYLSAASQYSIQYHVAHDALWLVSRDSQFHMERDAGEGMSRYPLKEFVAKARRETSDPALGNAGWVGTTFASPTAGGSARDWSSSGADFMPETYTDFMVTGPLSVRQFVLKNHAGPYRGLENEEVNVPKWSMTAHSYTGVWQERSKTYKGKWKKEESLPVAFREPFQLLTRGDDYYFVTRSGKVFLSAKPAKGKGREMTCIWSDAKRKVVGLVTDAKTGRSFLFCRASAGSRPSYFELGPKPQPVEYGAKAPEFPEAEGMLEVGRRYARALIADGKVVLPAKAGAKP